MLVSAWHSIRRNAETSQTASTKRTAVDFGRNLPGNIRHIQDRLRRGYKFEKAFGATPAKGSGKAGKRPIVVAPLKDRVVQRAILDVLQDARDLPRVQAVLATPTSIGGIRDRGVDTAIALFDEQVRSGHTHVAGSDIASFFTKIQPSKVLDFLRDDIAEEDFLELVQSALVVELKNIDTISAEDRRLFPTGSDGVAQGSPLSALAGNIVLHDFDKCLNEVSRGVTCIRYIDDFIITGRSERAVRKAMDSARGMLLTLGMNTYDPVASPTKAFIGRIGEPHVFLGHELTPGSYPPCQNARDKLLARIDGLLRSGRTSIDRALKGQNLTAQDRCFAQTLAAVDNVIKGWRGSFRKSSSPAVFAALDRQIDGRLRDFENGFHAAVSRCDGAARRRALGVRSMTP